MEQKERSSIGAGIKARRKAAALSQRQLAEICGVTQQTISLYEKGAVEFNYGVMKKILRAMNLDTLQGISGDTYMNTEDERLFTAAEVGTDIRGGIPHFEFFFFSGTHWSLKADSNDDSFYYVNEHSAVIWDLNQLYSSLNKKGKSVALKTLFDMSKTALYTEKEPEILDPLFGIEEPGKLYPTDYSDPDPDPAGSD